MSWMLLWIAHDIFFSDAISVNKLFLSFDAIAARHLLFGMLTSQDLFTDRFRDGFGLGFTLEFRFERLLGILFKWRKDFKSAKHRISDVQYRLCKIQPIFATRFRAASHPHGSTTQWTRIEQSRRLDDALFVEDVLTG
jgi:hypothetical protein